METQTIQVPVEEFSSQIHKWQLEILRKFDNKEFRFALLRWHRRARKTTLLINILIRECCRNAKKVYGYIAPTYTQAKGIIWTDPNMLDKYLPKDFIKRKNESELLVEFKNQSILAIKGADNPDSIRGQDYEGVGIDEFALIKLSIWEEILRPIIAQDENRWAIFAFTPKGINHAYDYWCKAENWEGWHRSFLKASESNLLLSTELELAKSQMPEVLYNQEFECEFTAGEEYSLILPSAIEALKGVSHFIPRTKKLLSCDPSMGGDECVIYIFENTKVIEEKIVHHNDTMKIVGEIIILMEKHKLQDAVIDSIGIGKGIVDRLSEMGKNVVAVNSAEEANDKDKFYNRRAEMWWYLMEQIQAREIEYIEDIELIRQLSSVCYKVINSNGKIQLEPKLDTKARLGRSPDRGDAFVYGIWGLKEIKDSDVNISSLKVKRPIFSGAGGY